MADPVRKRMAHGPHALAIALSKGAFRALLFALATAVAIIVATVSGYVTDILIHPLTLREMFGASSAETATSAVIVAALVGIAALAVGTVLISRFGGDRPSIRLHLQQCALHYCFVLICLAQRLGEGLHEIGYPSDSLGLMIAAAAIVNGVTLNAMHYVTRPHRA